MRQGFHRVAGQRAKHLDRLALDLVMIKAKLPELELLHRRDALA
jgi:hypothetical protein